MQDPILRQIASFLPSTVSSALEELSPNQQQMVEELHFRIGCEVTVVAAGAKERPLSMTRPLLCTHDMVQSILNSATSYSIYASGEMLRYGFLSLPGGHRLGLCGTAVVEQGFITTLKSVSSINFRIARQRLGCADKAIQLTRTQLGNTLIIGPPNAGKTTLLRDFVRQLSDQLGQRVGIVDSRGEIAASFDGVPQLQVGRTADVISMAPKDQGMEILLRTMNPQWIAVDEITSEQDVEAMIRASYCGVYLIATAHAFCREDLYQRPVYRRLLKTGLFSNLIILDEKRQFRLEEVEKTC